MRRSHQQNSYKLITLSNKTLNYSLTRNAPSKKTFQYQNDFERSLLFDMRIKKHGLIHSKKFLAWHINSKLRKVNNARVNDYL